MFHRFKRQTLSHVTAVRWVLGIVILIAIILAGIWIRQQLKNISHGIGQVIYSVSNSSLPEHAGRVNLLILGVGGGTHEGFDLTDTILFVSTNINTGDTVLVSIPRDIWVASSKSKINATYHYGEERQPGTGGLISAKAAVTEIINQPVDYAAVIDFSTFTKFIDTIGGVDVSVDRTFDDLDYPIAGKEDDLCSGDPDVRCRYEHVHFDQGLQHMDGTTALKFVRSRHSTDPEEGSDFARSRRQEKVISAIKAKLISPEIIKRPHIYEDLITLLSQSVKTDIPQTAYYNLFKLGLKVKDQTLRTAALTDPDQLYHPDISSEFDNQWVLLPKTDLTASVSAFLVPN
jgi:polyisoprenyl-teichoic acid--peptidoglycan teichoic acid transferase